MYAPPPRSREEIELDMLEILHECFGCGIETTGDCVHITFPPIAVEVKKQKKKWWKFWNRGSV